jgi:hypothetical protein
VLTPLCPNICACVLAFSKAFSRVSTLFTTPLDPSNACNVRSLKWH